MSNINISGSEYEELLDKASKLEALENGGVDNWEFYGEAMSSYFEGKEAEERLDKLVVSILEAASEDVDINPAGPGTGVALMVDPSIIKNLIKEYQRSSNA